MSLNLSVVLDLPMDRKTAFATTLVVANGLAVVIPFIPSRASYPPCHCPVGKVCSCPAIFSATLYASPSYYAIGIGAKFTFIRGRLHFNLFEKN
jgi:hypothetical protein